MIKPVITTKLTTTATTTVTVEKPVKIKKAGKQGVLITMIIDESGSMGVVRDGTITGFNEFVAGQRDSGFCGAGYLTLVKFEGWKVETVYHNRPLSEVPALDYDTYQPAGGTNLLDAIGDTIKAVNAVLSDKKKKDRPGVIITIMTDGEENSSRRYTNQQIKDLVAAAEKADWTFQFLGANIDAFSVGSTFGMHAANSVNYDTSSMADTFASVGASTVRMRMAKSVGMTTSEIYSSGLYTADELNKMNTKK